MKIFENTVNEKFRDNIDKIIKNINILIIGNSGIIFGILISFNFNIMLNRYFLFFLVITNIAYSIIMFISIKYLENSKSLLNIISNILLYFVVIYLLIIMTISILNIFYL